MAVVTIHTVCCLEITMLIQCAIYSENCRQLTYG